MGINIETETNRSIYIQEAFEIRTETPVQKGARELIRKYSRTKRVLDIGCSDLVTTRYLANEGYTLFGVDLNITALKQVNTIPANVSLINADITELPLKNKTDIDMVVCIETLEHLSTTEALYVLKSLPDLCRDDFTAIISMPIISAKSITYLREYFKMVINGKRPDRGLLDKTHQIFTDKSGHKEIFQQANLYPIEEYTTNPYTGISGSWSFDPTPTHRNNSQLAQLYRKVLTTCPRVIHPFDQAKQEAFFDTLVGFSGLYVLKHKTPS